MSNFDPLYGEYTWSYLQSNIIMRRGSSSWSYLSRKTMSQRRSKDDRFYTLGYIFFLNQRVTRGDNRRWLVYIIGLLHWHFHVFRFDKEIYLSFFNIDFSENIFFNSGL